MKTRSWFWHDFKRAFELYPASNNADGFAAPGFLRAHYAARRDARGAPRRALDRVVASGFRFWIRRRAAATRRKYDLSPEWEAKAVRIADACFADPAEIALFRIESEADCKAWLRKFEHAAINKRISPRGWRADCVLRDKPRFYEIAAAHDVAAPETFATCAGGRIDVRRTPKSARVAVKPSDAGNGVGFTVLNLTEAERASDAAFADALRRRVGAKVDWIAQSLLENHEALRPISLNALATIRLITIKNERDAPEAVSGVLRFALSPERLVDNRGGAAGIDQSSGRLGAGCIGKGFGDFDHHPETGVRIDEIIVPEWDALKASATAFHREAFDDYAVIGWDIAPTPSGPVFVEGNNLPCSTLAQRPLRIPIGEQRYGQLIAHHLEKHRNR